MLQKIPRLDRGRCTKQAEKYPRKIEESTARLKAVETTQNVSTAFNFAAQASTNRLCGLCCARSGSLSKNLNLVVESFKLTGADGIDSMSLSAFFV